MNLIIKIYELMKKLETNKDNYLKRDNDIEQINKKR